jgi:hypothetical protein
MLFSMVPSMSKVLHAPPPETQRVTCSRRAAGSSTRALDRRDGVVARSSVRQGYFVRAATRRSVENPRPT